VQWPNDVEGNRIENNDDERLSKVAALVLKLLRPKHRTTTLETPAGKAYVQVLDLAREYFEQRTPETFDALTRVGDASPAKKNGKKKSSKR
jgi:hypothetical protein